MGQPIDTASVEIVPDFSAFPRQLKAGVDAALRGMVSQIDRAFDDVERGAGEAGRDMAREIGRGGERAEGALREVGRTATKEMAQVAAASSAAGSTVGARIASGAALAKAALLGMTVAVGAGLAAMVGFGLKSAASIEQTTIGLEALTGSAETAKAFLEELQQFAAATPFEFAGVADASRRILAFGQSVGIAQDEVIPTITTIGNLVSVLGGTQENVDAVVRAFGQVASKGRLMGGEILQISEALPGFNANQAIAASLGVSVAEAMEMQEKGEIDATTAINALLSGMAAFPGAAGAMEKQAQTLLGVFSTFKDTVSIALTNAFQPVIPAIKESLGQLTPVLGQAIGQLAPVLGGLVAGLLPLLGSLVQGLVPILMPILDALTQSFAAIGPVVVPVGQALGGIAAALAPILPMFADLAATLISALLPVITQLTPVFNQLVGAVLPIIMDVLAPLLPIVVQVATVLASLLAPILFVVTKVFEKLGPPILKIVMALATLLMPIIDALAPVIGSLIVAFLPFLDIIAILLEPLVETVMAFMPLVDVILALIPAALAIQKPLIDIITLIIKFLAQAGIVPLISLLAKNLALVLSPLNLLVPLIEDFTKQIKSLDWGAIGSAIGGFFVDAWNKIKQFFSFIFDSFMKFPENARLAFTLVRDRVLEKINEVVGFLQSLPGRALSAIGNFGSLLFQKGVDLIVGLWNGISSMGGWLWGKIKSFVSNNILGPVGRFLGISSPSTVFRDEIGRQIPAGIAEGISAGIPDLQALIAPIIPGRTAGGVPAAGPGMSISGVTVNVMFSGVVPTEAEARRTGAAAGAGVAEAIQRRAIGLAVRTA